MRTRAFSIVLLAIVALLALSLFFGTWYTVDEGERAVVLRTGAVSRVSEPGLHLKIPFLETVVHMSVRTEKHVYQQMESYSKDIQAANLIVSINYRLDRARVAELYGQFGRNVAERRVDPVVINSTKVVFGRFNAATAISERTRLIHEIAEEVRQELSGDNVIVESVQVENIDFSAGFQQSIEARMQAEIEVSRLRQNLEREKVQADIQRTQAQARADFVRAQALAELEGITLRGNAEATAIKARGDALRQNPELIGLIQAERWDGKLPTTMVPGSTVPFLGVK